MKPLPAVIRCDRRDLSQPAVSEQLKSLEQQIGRTLFTRTPRGIIPTAGAHDLARSIAPHIDALETAGDQGGQSSEIEGTIQIGGPVEFLTQRVLPSLVPLVRVGLYLRVTLGSTEQLLEALSKNDLDLAVVGHHKKSQTTMRPARSLPSPRRACSITAPENGRSRRAFTGSTRATPSSI
jgi:DNA-binding transcriptional LysR family regulator